MRARSETSPRSPARPTRSTPGCWRSFAGETWCPRSGCLCRGSGAARAASAPGAPGEGAHLRSQPDLRPAHPVRAADLLRAAGASRTELELLERRGVPAVWRASITGPPRAGRGDGSAGSARSTASSPRWRKRMSARSCCRRSRGSGHCSALTFAAEIGEISRFSSASEAGRLCGARPAGEPVGRALSDRAALKGRVRGRSAGPRSRPPTKPGGRRIRVMPTIGAFRPGTERTRRSRRSPESF